MVGSPFHVAAGVPFLVAISSAGPRGSRRAAASEAPGCHASDRASAAELVAGVARRSTSTRSTRPRSTVDGCDRSPARRNSRQRRAGPDVSHGGRGNSGAARFLCDLPPVRSAAVRGNKPAGPAVTVISNRRAADGPPNRGAPARAGAACRPVSFLTA